MNRGAAVWRECLKRLSIARSLALAWGCLWRDPGPRPWDFPHKRIYGVHALCAGMSGVLLYVGRPRAAVHINLIFGADGGANFDARVCILLPGRHDSSEKKASPRA